MKFTLLFAVHYLKNMSNEGTVVYKNKHYGIPICVQKAETVI